jgi:pimeloyl-ACP methyl ester carboxylesterase
MSVQLAYEVVGAGPPVVILHGLCGSSRNWRGIADALADSHRVYLPDARNHGASPRAQTMSYGAMARDVLALIECERLQQPLVIGHSMGGKTAMALALEQPQAIAGVAVIDVAPEQCGDQFSRYVTAMRGLDTAGASGRKEARQALEQSLGGDAPVESLMQNLRRHDERFDVRLNLLAVAMCMQELCAFPRPLLNKCYDGPALFVSGADSDYVRPESRTVIARLFRNAELQTIADAGHWVHADQPHALLRVLKRWLCEASARRDALPVPAN